MKQLEGEPNHVAADVAVWQRGCRHVVQAFSRQTVIPPTFGARPVCASNAWLRVASGSGWRAMLVT
jgi:hypothetical protein